MMKLAAIVPAAGRGTRIRSKIEKPYIKLCGKPILAHTLLRLADNKNISEIIVAVSRKNIYKTRRGIVERYNIKKVKVVAGGRERKDSVFNALKNLSRGINYVLIHDGIRPFITDSLIDSSVKAAQRFGASVVAVPVKPTLKCVLRNGRIGHTPDRRNFLEAQTPQVFRRDLIERAYRKKQNKKMHVTDDSMLVEKLGVRPKAILGSYDNIKITTQEDLVLAEILADKLKF